MKYDDARPLIQSGDLISVYRPAKFSLAAPFRGIISFFTRSDIFHTGIALWMTSPSGIRRLMIVETKLGPGKRIVPMSVYMMYKMDVIALPATLPFEKMEEFLMLRIAQQSYGYFDLLQIGIRTYFRIKEKLASRGEVCSELCATAWVESGAPILDTTIGPGQLHDGLVAMGYPVTINIDV